MECDSSSEGSLGVEGSGSGLGLDGEGAEALPGDGVSCSLLCLQNLIHICRVTEQIKREAEEESLRLCVTEEGGEPNVTLRGRKCHAGSFARMGRNTQPEGPFGDER